MITTISKEEKSPKGKKNFLILTSQKQIELFFFGYKTDLNGWQFQFFSKFFIYGVWLQGHGNTVFDLEPYAEK